MTYEEIKEKLQAFQDEADTIIKRLIKAEVISNGYGGFKYEECVEVMNYMPIKLLEEAYHLITPDESFYWDNYIEVYKLAIVNVYETRILEDAINQA